MNLTALDFKFNQHASMAQLICHLAGSMFCVTRGSGKAAEVPALQACAVRGKISPSLYPARQEHAPLTVCSVMLHAGANLAVSKNAHQLTTHLVGIIATVTSSCKVEEVLHVPF